MSFTEIWFLEYDDAPGRYLPPIDDCDGVDCTIAFFSEDDALLASEVHKNIYGIDSHPVRVFPQSTSEIPAASLPQNDIG